MSGRKHNLEPRICAPSTQQRMGNAGKNFSTGRKTYWIYSFLPSSFILTIYNRHQAHIFPKCAINFWWCLILLRWRVAPHFENNLEYKCLYLEKNHMGITLLKYWIYKNRKKNRVSANVSAKSCKNEDLDLKSPHCLLRSATEKSILLFLVSFT